MPVEALARLTVTSALAALALTACAGSGHAKTNASATQATSTATTVAQQTTPAAADAGPAVRGPGAIVPGAIVSFRASGFRPGNNLVVTLSPADKGPCCAVRIPASFLVPSSGSRKLTFRVPPNYRHCSASGTGACSRVAWRRGERVIVTALGYLEQADGKTTIAGANT